MEKIALHIEYLLLSHDCVIVPGFGAFIIGYEAPVFDMGRGIITPMKREVRFNSALRADDGLVAGSYARKYGISYREASDLLSKDVSALSRLLTEEREITFGNIGVIRVTEDEKLLFTPFRTADKLAKDLGFLAVPFMKGVSDSLHTLKKHVKEEEKDNADLSDVVSAETDSKERKLDFNRNYYIAVNKIFAKVAASIILILAVAITVLVPSSERGVREDRASVVPVDRILESGKVVEEDDNVLESVEDENAVPAIDIEKIDEDTPLSPEYFLIVGTFRTEEEALKFASYHSGCKYDLEIIPSGKVVRVSAKRSADRHELQAEMSAPSLREAFAESWIWEKEQ